MPRGRRAKDKVDATISQDGISTDLHMGASAGVLLKESPASDEERRHVPFETRKLIAERLEAGDSYQKIIDEIGTSKATISRIAQEFGVSVNRFSTQNAALANRWLAVASRLGLLAKLFDRVDKLSDEVKSPRDVKDLALTAAILVDKVRLETGESTSRTETIDRTAGARQRLLERLQTYSARKDADGVYVVEPEPGATGS